jgi:hypothetical protein
MGRAKYICPKCKGDVSLMWFYYMMCVIETEELLNKNKKSNGKTSKKTSASV